MCVKGVKPFDVTALTRANFFDPKEAGYQDSVDIIYDELHKTRRSFVKIGWYLKHIGEAEMYKEEGYSNLYEFALDKFNISQSTAARFINICREFSAGHDSPELDEKYLDFSVSQLFEMIPMRQEQREQVTPDMPVKKIRDIKNEAKSEVRDKKEDFPEPDDDIPGQTSIENDFPEYMPDNPAEVVEISEDVQKTNEEPDDMTSYSREKYATSHMDPECIKDDIETFADNVRMIMSTWKGRKIPLETMDEVKENALKLTNAIEKLSNIIS